MTTLYRLLIVSLFAGLLAVKALAQDPAPAAPAQAAPAQDAPAQDAPAQDAQPAEPAAPTNAAIVPTPRQNLMNRHEAFLERARMGDIDVLFMGDSITDGWDDAGLEVWNQKYANRKAANFGIGGDRTEHVLWRIQNGELEGISPKVVVLMIGTNNTSGGGRGRGGPGGRGRAGRGPDAAPAQDAPNAQPSAQAPAQPAEGGQANAQPNAQPAPGAGRGAGQRGRGVGRGRGGPGAAPLTPAQIAEGVELIVKTTREKLPNSKILLLAVFPRDAQPDTTRRQQIAEINEIIARLDDGMMIKYLDIGKAFLTDEGELTAEIMPDALHPNARGYEIWAEAMEPTLSAMLAD